MIRMIAIGLGCAASTAAAAVPLQVANPSFESGAIYEVDDLGFGHANLPEPWTSPTPGDPFISGDTWSQLGGTRGLLPTANNVFPQSMVAYHGNRWAGGWSFEYISQPLQSGLVAGSEYTIEAAVHASNLGSGTIEISFGTSASDRSILGGVFPGVTTLADGWQLKSLTFVATPEMAGASWFHFRAYSFTGATTYMAVDTIPAPCTAAILGLACCWTTARRRAAS
jgi:hypothetical protein